MDTVVLEKKRRSSKRLSRHKSNPSEATTELPPEFISRSTSKEKKKRRSLALPPIPLDSSEPPPKDTNQRKSISTQMSTSSSSTESLRSSSRMDITPPYSPGKTQHSTVLGVDEPEQKPRNRPSFHRYGQNGSISELNSQSSQKLTFGSQSDTVRSSTSTSAGSIKSYLCKPQESVVYSEYKDGLLCVNTVSFDDVTFCFVCEKDFIQHLSNEKDLKSASNQLVSKDLLKKVTAITGCKMDSTPVYRQIYVCADCYENIRIKEALDPPELKTDMFKMLEQKKCRLCFRALAYFSAK